MAQRYCTACGAELSEDARFCGSCGRPAHETAAVATPEADVRVPRPTVWDQNPSPRQASGPGVGTGFKVGCGVILAVLLLVFVLVFAIPFMQGFFGAL